MFRSWLYHASRADSNAHPRSKNPRHHNDRGIRPDVGRHRCLSAVLRTRRSRISRRVAAEWVRQWMTKKHPCASSTFSPESVDSHTPSNASAQKELFVQLPSVNRTSSVRPSCESTGPTSQSLTTLENSEAWNPPSQMELISSVAGSRSCASPGVRPGSKEARKMTETSGRRWLPLLKSYNLSGSLARTCAALLTSQWGSSAAFLTWKASATAPSHLLFQLAPSMPRTGETESGFWPTPTARDFKDVNKKRKAYALSRGGHTTSAVTESYLRGVEVWEPELYEKLMGFPVAWTDLKPSETQSARRSSRKSAK